jgi:predicted transposase YbfD/YdcC
VNEKSNEIVAIPALLDMMSIEGAVVTIDAIGCQRSIARKIIDKKADYIIALKGNQGTLHEDAGVFAAEQKANGFKDTTVSRHETVDGDHGRIETRTYTVIHDVAWLQERHDWPGLPGVIVVESQREIDGRITKEARFYITSLGLLATAIGPMIRDHWAVENCLQLGHGHGLSRRRMPRAHRTCAGQLHNPQTHGAESDQKSTWQGLATPKAQNGRLGR